MSSILYLFIITERNWRFEILLGSRIVDTFNMQYANIIDIELLSVEQIDLKKRAGFLDLQFSRWTKKCIYYIYSI